MTATLAALVRLDAPHGPSWEFLVLFAVVVAGARLVERARAPGVVGLLLGGFLVGPHGLDLITSGDRTIPEIGQVGLLYLMFVAGVEVDLKPLRHAHRPTVAFGALSFALPLAAGAGVGLALGWEPLPSLLLGSLLASHTPLGYPGLRRRGLGADRAVSVAVGATVLTDTLALLVLAAVSGLEMGEGAVPVVAARTAAGLVALGAYAFVVLPSAAGWALRVIGADRGMRYLVAICGFLSAATVAEVLGIQGVVGAFLAGVALNRLVPDEGPLMGQIEFFGAAVFIPVFLVSVGFVLDPAVLLQPDTLGCAALMAAACLGGKAAAAWAGARLLGLSPPQAGLMFALTAPQAAAALAGTIVGYEIGLFGTAVVDAVLVVILLSIVAAGGVTVRAAPQAPCPPPAERALGDRVVLAVAGDDPPRAAYAVAAALVAPDGGAVDTVLVSTGPDHPPPSALTRLDALATEAGLDGTSTLRVDRSFAHAVLDAAVARRASAVVVAGLGPALAPGEPWAEAVARAGAAAVPVVVVAGTGPAGRLRGARLVAPPDEGLGCEARQLAAEVAARLGLGCCPAGSAGEATVVPVTGWAAASGLVAPDDGSVLVVVPPPGPAPRPARPPNGDPADPADVPDVPDVADPTGGAARQPPSVAARMQMSSPDCSGVSSANT